MQIKINIKNVLSIKELKYFIINRSIKAIIFGETHGFFNDLAVQEFLIEKLNPDYYLYEMLEDKKIISNKEFDYFLSREDKSDFSVISRFGEIKPAINMAKKYNMKIIGCDIKNMGRRNKKFLERKKLTSEEEKFEEVLLKKREKNQAKIIKNLIKKSNSLIFVSIGAYHLRKESEIWNDLKEKNILVCYPAFRGKQQFGPQKGMKKEDISYVIQEKEDYIKKKK